MPGCSKDKCYENDTFGQGSSTEIGIFFIQIVIRECYLIHLGNGLMTTYPQDTSRHGNLLRNLF